MATIQVAITQRVLPGKEAEFDKALREFVRNVLEAPGTHGAIVIAPRAGTDDREYRIVRSFDSIDDLNAFYSSERYHAYLQQIEPLVEPQVRRHVEGLAVFFPEDDDKPPPKWKLATVTWLAVYPSALFWAYLLDPIDRNWPRPVTIAVLNALVVVILAWLLMPWLTGVFARWLRPNQVR